MSEPGVKTHLPWSDCKVAFPIKSAEKMWELWEKGNCAWPEKWELVETDGAGARYVAVFRVRKAVTIEDGEIVAKLLRKI